METTGAKTTLNLDTNLLKLVAVAAMLCDHIGKIFLPDAIILQVIGRIAFPLFAYCIAVGCLYTRDIVKYLLRMVVFFVISQPLYTAAFHPTMEDFLANIWVFNIFLDLACGILVLWGIRDRTWVFSGLGIVVAALGNTEYGFTGITLMVIFYLFRSKKGLCLGLAAILLALPLFFSDDLTVGGISLGLQGFAVLALPLLAVRTSLGPRINKYFFYGFYPGHLAVLWLVQLAAR